MYVSWNALLTCCCFQQLYVSILLQEMISYIISLHIYSGNSWMYPYHRTSTGNPYISPISCVFMGYNFLQMQPSKHQTIAPLPRFRQSTGQKLDTLGVEGQDLQWDNGQNMSFSAGIAETGLSPRTFIYNMCMQIFDCTVAGFSPSAVKIGQICTKTAIVPIESVSRKSTQSKSYGIVGLYSFHYAVPQDAGVLDSMNF